MFLAEYLWLVYRCVENYCENSSGKNIFREITTDSTFVQVCLITCLYMYCRWRFSYHKERVVIPLTGLILPHWCAYSKLGPGFSTSYVMVVFRCGIVMSFFCFCFGPPKRSFYVQWAQFRWEVIFSFVDIGVSDCQHCLIFFS